MRRHPVVSAVLFVLLIAVGAIVASAIAVWNSAHTDDARRIDHTDAMGERDAWPAEFVSVFGRIPRYLTIDRRDRGDFLRTFFRRYEGASVEGVQALIDSPHLRAVYDPGSLAEDPGPVRPASPGPARPTGRTWSF